MIRRTGIVSMIGLTAYLCCGMSSPDSCGPSRAQVYGGAVAVVAVVGVAIAVPIVIQHKHHNIKGCVFSDQYGLQLLDIGESKIYALSGITPDIKVGDTVYVHGSKLKHPKGAPGDQTFVVDKVTKDYGPCKIPATLPDDTKPAAVPQS